MLVNITLIKKIKEDPHHDFVKCCTKEYNYFLLDLGNRVKTYVCQHIVDHKIRLILASYFYCLIRSEQRHINITSRDTFLFLSFYITRSLKISLRAILFNNILRDDSMVLELHPRETCVCSVSTIGYHNTWLYF